MVEKNQLLVLSDLGLWAVFLVFLVRRVIEAVIYLCKNSLWLRQLVVFVKLMGREANELAILFLLLCLWHYFHQSRVDQSFIHKRGKGFAADNDEILILPSSQ